jgi:protein SCO1
MIALVLAAAVATSGLDNRVGTQIPLDQPFTTSTGEHVTLAHYFQPHRPVVLVIGYARCQMLCNVVLRSLADAIKTTPLQAGRDYEPIVISLDPRETVEEASRRQATLLDLAHTRQWPYLVGDVAPLANVLGFHYTYDARTDQYAHPAVVFVLTPDGRVSSELRGVVFPFLGDAIARAARGELAPPDAEGILRCFHFDPALARYQSRMQTFFRIGAGLVFHLLMTGLGLIVRRRR